MDGVKIGSGAGRGKPSSTLQSMPAADWDIVSITRRRFPLKPIARRLPKSGSTSCRDEPVIDVAKQSGHGVPSVGWSRSTPLAHVPGWQSLGQLESVSKIVSGG